MSDLKALQGLWRIQSSTYEGKPVLEAATHYLITGQSIQEIVPDLVDDGILRTTFLLDESASPKRLIETLDYNGPDGPPDPDPIVLRFVYQLEGDTLVLCSGPSDAFPESISDKYSIQTLVRDRGPVPQSRQPSGTLPLVDELLGTLRWDDNLKWYHGRIDVPGASFDLNLRPAEGTNASGATLRARTIVRDFERYRQMAEAFAIDGLLGLKNGSWLDEDEAEITADEFRSRMTLEAVTVEANGVATFWHDDGDLFRGHCIQVRIDADDRCTSTEI